MNARNVKILAAVVLVLFAVLFALNSMDRSDSPAAGGEILFPELKSRLNDLNVVSITDADGSITLRREAADGDSGPSAGGRWISPDHGGYPADPADLRQLLLAIADARKIEQKTSDPELYDRLGVANPREEGGSGVLISARGDNAAVSLILGDVAQREFRYARIPEEAPSWLINQNPVLPDDPGGWLLPDIVDIDASRIASAVIRHPDGELVRIRKQDAGDVNFEVEDIPEGRQLSYPSVANGIAGVLADLTLEDVRPANAPAEGTSTAEFRTFDGLEIFVSIHTRSGATGIDGEIDESGDTDSDSDTDDLEEHWITVRAGTGPVPPATAEAAVKEPADDSAEPAGNDAESTGTDVEPTDKAEPASPDDGEGGAEKRNPADEAREINERVAGWTYRIPTYKADQLTRRLTDLLSDPETD